MSALEFCDIALQVCAGCFFLVIAAMVNDLISPLFFPVVSAVELAEPQLMQLPYPMPQDYDSSPLSQEITINRLWQNLPVQGMNLDDSLDVGQTEPSCVRLEDMSVKELYALCREHSIKKYSRKNKAQIIKELSCLI